MQDPVALTRKIRLFVSPVILLAFIFCDNAIQTIGWGAVLLAELLNFVAMAANGGMMPVMVDDNTEVASLTSESPIHQQLTTSSKLKGLTDVFWFSQNPTFRFSIGDVFLYTGSTVIFIGAIVSFI